MDESWTPELRRGTNKNREREGGERTKEREGEGVRQRRREREGEGVRQRRREREGERERGREGERERGSEGEGGREMEREEVGVRVRETSDFSAEQWYLKKSWICFETKWIIEPFKFCSRRRCSTGL
jgi:hypothetical protein